MATVLEILTRSARALGVVRAGQAPTGNDAADLLQKMQDAVNGLPLLRDGEWSDVTLTSAAAYEAEDGERVHTAGYAASITLPTTYTDEDGVEKRTRDLSRVQIIGGEQEGLWVYSASNGSWSQVDALELTSESPFGPEDSAGLAAIVAFMAGPEYGAPAEAPTVALAQSALNSFRARFYRDVQVMAAPEHVRNSEMGFSNFYDESFS